MIVNAIQRLAPSTAAFVVAASMHVALAVGLLYMPQMDIIPPQVDGGFEVVDLSAFGVAAMPELEPEQKAEPVEEPVVEKAPKEPEPLPEPEVVEKLEPAPLPMPKPKPKPVAKPVAQPVAQPQVNPVAKPVAQPDVQPQTQTVGSQHAFVPPSSHAAYLRNPKPTYPAIAQQRGMEGMVLVYVEVSARGEPLSVTLKQSSGFVLLDKAALKAVHGWRFAPATRGGQPVAAGVEVPIRFSLNDA